MCDVTFRIYYWPFWRLKEFWQWMKQIWRKTPAQNSLEKGEIGPKKTQSCSWRLQDCWVRDEGLEIIMFRDLWFYSRRTMLFIAIVYDVLLSLKDGKDNFRILYWQNNKKTFWGFLCLHPFSSGRWFCQVFVLVLLKWFQKCFPTTVLIDSHFGICFISWL